MRTSVAEENRSDPRHGGKRKKFVPRNSCDGLRRCKGSCLLRKSVFNLQKVDRYACQTQKKSSSSEGPMGKGPQCRLPRLAPQTSKK